MMHRGFYRTILLLLFLLGTERAALACAGPASESHVTRAHPVKSVPEGAIQLMVDIDRDEGKMRSKRNGKITIPVRKVLNGQFDKKTITFSFQNESSCDYFGPTGNGRYLVLYPLHYAEGDPVLDEFGNQDLYIIRYNYNIDPSYLGVLDEEGTPPKAETYSCARRGGDTSEAIEACIKSNEPQKLYRNGAGNSMYRVN